MKAGIITHYDVHNHGAQLQLYALSCVLKDLGYIDTKALRYNKNYDFLPEGIENKYNISLKSISVYLKYVLKKGIRCTIFNFNKRKQLSKFRKNNNLVGNFYSKETLDLTVVGSDEVFSFEAGPNPWFWGFGIDAQKIISYAASFGPCTIDFLQKHKVEAMVKGGIQNFDFVSVRDKNSQDILYSLTSVKPTIVCDPVLLYGFQNEILDVKQNKKFSPVKYILIYSYDDNFNDCIEVKQIKNIAKKQGLKIISAGYFHKWCDKNINVDPLKIFGYFLNAEYVITDTFHGSVLSILCNSDFFVKINGNSNKLAFLLSEYNLENRIVNDFSKFDSTHYSKIDYERVNELIRNNRKHSLEFLKEALNGK